MTNKKYDIQIEIAGRNAMWCRSDTGDSPVSGLVPSREAAKEIFSAVLWGPGIEIIPWKIEVCSPIQFESYATNYSGPLRKDKNVKDGTNYQQYATVLVDVIYRIYAYVIASKVTEELPESAQKWISKTTSPAHAYQEIFNRRLQRGQSYASLFLGWKDFPPTYFGPFRESTKVNTGLTDIIIPSMLLDVFPNGYNSEVSYVYAQNVNIHNGTLIYPER